MYVGAETRTIMTRSVGIAMRSVSQGESGCAVSTGVFLVAGGIKSAKIIHRYLSEPARKAHLHTYLPMSGFKHFAVAGAGTIGTYLVEELLKTKRRGDIEEVRVRTRSVSVVFGSVNKNVHRSC